MGAVVCDLVDTGSKEQEADKEDILKQGLPLPLKLVQLETFFKDLETKYGTYDVHKQFASPRSMDIFMLCTRSEIRQQGLGTKLILQALDTAREEGLKLVHSLALSSFSQAIFRRHGFKAEFVINYDEYEQNGMKIFDTREIEGHKDGQYMVLHITQ